jgi:hypothetical protein
MSHTKIIISSKEGPTSLDSPASEQAITGEVTFNPPHDMTDKEVAEVICKLLRVFKVKE